MHQGGVTPGQRAGIYCRASSDPKERGLSVETQEEDGRAWCALNGIEVDWVIVDNNYSASLWASKERPGYKQVRANLAGAAPVDILVARDSSRITRDLEAYVQVRSLCAKYKVLWAYNGRLYDLKNTGDRFETGLDALLAERRASEIRDDVVKSVAKRVRTGKPHGKVAYGYTPVYDPHTGAPTGRIEDPETASVVRRIVAAVLAERSIYSICAELDAGSVPAPEAVRRWRRGVEGPSLSWTHRSIRDIARNPTYAGYRTHNGEIKGEGQWPALITAEDHQKVKNILDDPTRRASMSTVARHLLSGIVKCGRCGSTCARSRDGVHGTYQCSGRNKTWRSGSVRCVARRQLPLEGYVVDRLLLMLDTSDGAKMFSEPTDGAAPSNAARELAELEARLEEFRASAERPDGIPATTLARMEATYGPLIIAAKAQLVPASVPKVVREALRESDIRAWWADESTLMSTKRAMIRALMEITIHPSTRRGANSGFDASTIQIRWLYGRTPTD